MHTTEQLSVALAGRYTISRLVGEGGMAKVYLAHDVRHERPVALKVLNPELGAVLGVERFLSEIKVTANLQHPNLLPLFDSGESGGLLFYVMPFVEGESLRARLQREKQLPIDDAVRIAVAVADALDYAHGHSVIHRDLKPENILLQHGQPVVADFGIALAVTKAGGNRITQTGLSLGTPQYMSPEQATGDRAIDGRSDIYSLAALTYEMLVGEPPHIGNTAQAIIARVLTDRPRSSRVMRPAVPEHVDAALERALEKLPADRPSTAREFADALGGKAGVPATVARSAAARVARPGLRARAKDPLVVALGLVALGAVAAFATSRRPAAPAVAPIRFIVSTPDSSPAFDNFPWPAAISPDGRQVVYSAAAAGSTRPQLWLLRTDQLYGHPIPGTEQAAQPSFSPDGQWVIYEASNKEWKVRLDGSTPVAVADLAAANGVDWTMNDEIVNGATGPTHGLSIYGASGGERRVLTHPDSAAGELEHVWPIAFPDGKAVAFAIWKGSLPTAQLAMARIPSGEVTRLTIKGVRPLAVLDGMLVYVQADGAVMAVTVNQRSASVTGRPIPVHDRVDVLQGFNGNSRVYVSRGGALVTGRGTALGRLAWLERSGVSRPLTKQPAGFFGPRLSPDQKRIAVGVTEADQADVWILDLRTGTLSRLTTSGTVTSVDWADNTHVVYTASGDSARNGIWRQEATGATPAQLLYQGSQLMPYVAAAPDGRTFVLMALRGSSWDILRVVIDSGRSTVHPYVASGAQELAPRISPDGKWLAYASDETGAVEVYVRSFPDPTTKVQISSGSAGAPMWSRDGKSILYPFGSKLMEARLAVSPTLAVLARDSLFPLANVPRSVFYTPMVDVGLDRTRLLTVTNDVNRYQLTVVPNWITEFRTRVAASRR